MIGVLRCGNSGSVLQALRYLGAEAMAFQYADEARQCESLSAIVLPGNGNFSAVMDRLSENGWNDYIREWIRKDLPFLGICVGLQVLFDESEEYLPCEAGSNCEAGAENARAEARRGFGIVRGKVRKFMNGKVPLIGWNKTRFRSLSQYSSVIQATGVEKSTNEYFYYLHSYYVDCEDAAKITATAEYGVEYCSCIEQGALTAVQFHPEKSGRAGLAFLARWMEATHAR